MFRHFRVTSIPTIICLDTNGNIITNCGVSNLEADPTGINFPWIYPALAKILGSTFIQAKGPLENEQDSIENFNR